MSLNFNRLLLLFFPLVGLLSLALSTDQTSVIATQAALPSSLVSTTAIPASFLNPQMMLDTSICFGSCISLGGMDYCDSGTYEYVDANGEMATLNLTVRPENNTATQMVQRCFGETFDIDFDSYDMSGIYPFTFEGGGADGCDSTINYILTILEEVPVTVVDTFLCAGECFEPPFVNSNKLCTTNFSEEIYQSANGCDSIVRVNVVIGANLTNRSKQTICVNSCIGIGDSTICETGQYDIVLESSTGCDSLVSIELTVDDEIINEFQEIICDGEIYEIADTALATTDRHFFRYESVLGCDSTVIVNLIVGEYKESRESVAICAGDEFEVNDGKGSIIRAGGDYNFVFQSHLGCDSVVTFSVTQLDTITITRVDTICFGDSLMIGDLAYTSSGVTRTVLSSEENCDSIINLFLTVLDCRIVAIVATDSTRCSDDLTGRFSFFMTEGSTPFTYDWASADSSQTGSGIVEELNQEVVVEGLPAGTYTAYVLDSIGIKASRLVFEISQPDYLSAGWTLSEFNNYNVSCADGTDGTLELEVSGGTGAYTYEWSNGGTTPKLNNLASGNYTVTVKDALNCSFIVDTMLSAPPPIDIEIETVKPNCDSFATGIIKVVRAEGGIMPLQYDLSGFGPSERSQFTGLQPGSYTLSVQDGNSCISQFQYNLPAPDIPALDYLNTYLVELADPVTLDIQSNVDLASIVWEEVLGLSCYDCLTPEADPLETTIYNFTATSNDGCTAEGAITVSVDKQRDVFVPNVFSPNSDGLNDRLTVFGGPEVAQIEMIRIFSRWGELVFEQYAFDANDPLIGWNGTFRGRKASAGSYVWIAKVLFVDGEVGDYKGDIVIR